MLSGGTWTPNDQLTSHTCRRRGGGGSSGAGQPTAACARCELLAGGHVGITAPLVTIFRRHVRTIAVSQQNVEQACCLRGHGIRSSRKYVPVFFISLIGTSIGVGCVSQYFHTYFYVFLLLFFSRHVPHITFRPLSIEQQSVKLEQQKNDQVRRRLPAVRYSTYLVQETIKATLAQNEPLHHTHSLAQSTNHRRPPILRYPTIPVLNYCIFKDCFPSEGTDESEESYMPGASQNFETTAVSYNMLVYFTDTLGTAPCISNDEGNLSFSIRRKNAHTQRCLATPIIRTQSVFRIQQLHIINYSINCCRCCPQQYKYVRAAVLYCTQLLDSVPRAPGATDSSVYSDAAAFFSWRIKQRVSRTPCFSSTMLS